MKMDCRDFILALIAIFICGLQVATAQECKVDGRIYKAGQKFADKACTAYCTCKGPFWGCVSLCPPMERMCPPDHQKKYRQQPIEGTECSCRRPYCVPRATCSFQGKRYRHGEQFISQCSKCRCTGGRISCLPLCPVALVHCLPGYKVVYKNTVLPGTNCQCRRPSCKKEEGTCTFEGKTYKAGDTFTDKGCTQRCRCVSSRRLCVPLCPAYGVKCGYNSKVVYNKVKVTPQCFCQRPKCVLRTGPDDDFCLFEGKKYRSGSVFTDKRCQLRCTCRGKAYQCVSLCPPMAVRCPSHKKLENYKVKVSEKCYCPRSKCVKRDPAEEFCTFEGKKFRSGTVFTDKNCGMRCTCRGRTHSCVSLCPPMAIRCPSHKKLLNYRVKVSEKCYCPRSKCIAKEPTTPKGCKIEGKTYTAGENFVDSKCTMSCRCRGPGYSCVSLCPPVGIVCPPGQEVAHYREPAILGCSCKRPRCILKG